MSVEVRIPANFVSAGWGIPTVCVRHGEAAVQNKKARFISRTPGWTYLLLIAALIIFVIVAAAIRKTVQAPSWPFCDQCLQQRKRRIYIGLGIVALGLIIGFGLGAAVGSDNAGGVWALAIIVIVAGLLTSLYGNWNAMAAGRVVEGGTLVLFPRAHEAFAAQAAAAQAAAAQHYAAQQQAYAQSYGQPYTQPGYAPPGYPQPGYAAPQGYAPPFNGQQPGAPDVPNLPPPTDKP